METEQFNQLLNNLLSNDNDVRQQAEETFNALQLEVKVQQLLATIHNGQQAEEARQLAAELLKSLFASKFHKYYNVIPQEAQRQFLQQILSAVELVDAAPNLRYEICEFVAVAVEKLITDDGTSQWPELLQFLFQWANSPNPQLQESALRIFANVPSICGNEEAKYLHLIKDILDENEHVEVRFQAVRAVICYILQQNNEKQVLILDEFPELLASILVVTAQSIADQSDQTVLKLLIELGENCPTFLFPMFDILFDMCVRILKWPCIEDSWRHLVLEVMITLCENAPFMVIYAVPNTYIIHLIRWLLQVIGDVDDDNDWYTDTEIHEDARKNNIVAETSLYRMAIGLGGEVVLPYIMHELPAMLNHHNWQQRYASLMAISVIGGGCCEEMEPLLYEIVAGVLFFLRDSHPRVRFAACQAIRRMCSWFAPTFQEKFHEHIIPKLLILMDDMQHPRIQAKAGAVLRKFAKYCPQVILTGYVADIMGKMETVLDSKLKELVDKGNNCVLEQVISIISYIAYNCEHDIVSYYDRVMPCLMLIAQNSNKTALCRIRQKSVECICLISLAAGENKLLNDAGDVIDLLLKIYSDDGMSDYLMTAWECICKILGKQFIAAMISQRFARDDDEIEDMKDSLEWKTSSNIRD